MALTIDSATTVEDFKVLFHRAEDKSNKLETEVKRLRHDTDVAVTTLKNEVVMLQAEAAASTQQRQKDRIDLIDNKMISPTLFDGGKVEAFKPWAKRLKAFCNAKCARGSGLRSTPPRKQSAMSMTQRLRDWVGNLRQVQTRSSTTYLASFAQERH